jgi:uncharacterized membrane protein YidH (DUF202 family)
VNPEVERDPGMQQERTTLAWRRTGLSLLVGSLTIGRLTIDSIGPLVVVPVVMTTAVALWIVASALRERRLSREHPGEPIFSVLSGGHLPAASALTIGLLAVAVAVSAVLRLTGTILP